MKNSPLKNFIASILLIVFIVTPFFLSNPNTVNAQLLAVPVSDQALELKETGFAIFGVPTGISLDGLAYLAANVLLARITDSVVSWINTGFQGSPAFIQDPEGWFVETADIASGELFEQLGITDFLCTPFAPIRASLVWNYQERKFTKDYKCKLSNAVNNFENFGRFTAGDFSGQGGWDTWFDITQNQSNNPFGVYVGAKLELDERIEKAIGVEEDQLKWGEGFLSTRRCLEPATIPDPNNPGQTLPDPNISHGCKKYSPIETPGSVVEDQLNNALHSEQDRINVADEINEILSALLNQLVTQVLAGGLSNMGGGGTIGTGGNAEFTVSCSASPAEVIFLNPQTFISQPVTYRATVVGGVGPTTYNWTLSGSPAPASPATSINLTSDSVTPVTYSSTGVGAQTARVSVTKDTGSGVMTKYATCNVNVLADPPLRVESCSVTPSVIPWVYNNTPPAGYVDPTWTIRATGGVLTPGTQSDMGYCIFDWRVGSFYHWVVTAPLIGTPAGSSCDLTTFHQTHGQVSGDLFKSVTVHSGSQTTNAQQCGPLTTTYP